MPDRKRENRFIVLSDVVSLYTCIVYKFKFHTPTIYKEVFESTKFSLKKEMCLLSQCTTSDSKNRYGLPRKKIYKTVDNNFYVEESKKYVHMELKMV